MKTQCDDCNVLMVNEVKCHEHGCPSAWIDEKRECQFCGDTFTPEFPRQRACLDCLQEDNE